MVVFFKLKFGTTKISWINSNLFNSVLITVDYFLTTLWGLSVSESLLYDISEAFNSVREIDITLPQSIPSSLK